MSYPQNVYLIVTYHFILSQSPCFIGQQISYSPQFLWYSTAPHHCPGNVFVVYYHPRVHNFTQI